MTSDPFDGRGVAATVFSWLADGLLVGQETGTDGWSEPHWEAARRVIQVHGIAPLLWAHRQAIPAWDRVAPSLQAYLAQQHRLNGERVTALMGELGAVLRRAVSEGIVALPLKGSVLVSQYYEDPALRPMADVDLLVRQGDEGTLAATIEGVGFHPSEERSTPRHRSFVRYPAGEPRLYLDGEHPLNPHVIEVHTVVGEGFAGKAHYITDDLWAGSRPGTCAGAPCLVIGPPSLLRHLLIHVAAEVIARKVRLLHLYDLTLVAAQLADDDWRRLLRTAEQLGETPYLYAPLALAGRYFHIDVPPWAMAQLEGGAPASLRRYLAQSDAYTLSLCRPEPRRLRDVLAWSGSGLGAASAIVRAVLPAEDYLHLSQLDLASGASPLRVYLAHLRQVLTWPLRRAMGVRREAPGRHRAGRVPPG
ncbi:MAG: nucleotidyltransferase domain-containing protein [Anaerolineae bacterium]